VISDPARSTPDVPVPLTLVTGFLGAGKTTLLDTLLARLAPRRWGVIVNEVAPLGIDQDLLTVDPGALVTLPNGCLCCTFQGDLVPAVRRLLEADGELAGILVETSGLAEPDPIVTACFMDPYLASHVQLDAVVTVVDGLRGPTLLADPELSELMHHQAAIADVLVVTRLDQAPEPHIARMVAWGERHAPLARIHAIAKGDLAPEWLVGLHAHDLRTGLPTVGHPVAAHDHGHTIGHEVLEFDRPLDARLLDRTLCELLREHGDDLLRCKGIVHLADEPERWIFQGAGPLFATSTGAPWQPDEPRLSRLVFIGRHLETMNLRERVTATLV